jgi:hypothetical protein
MHGQRISQLQFSRYSPLNSQDMAAPPLGIIAGHDCNSRGASPGRGVPEVGAGTSSMGEARAAQATAEWQRPDVSGDGASSVSVVANSLRLPHFRGAGPTTTPRIPP